MAKVFTGSITNTTFSINADNGIKYISIKNQSGSSRAITVAGTLGIGATASSTINVAAGEIVTISAGEDVIDSLTIVAGSGETVDIVASQ